MHLQRVKAGMKGLEIVLNKIIDAINANEPLEGAGMRFEKNANGTIINLGAQSLGGAGSGSGSSSGVGTSPATDDDSQMQSDIATLKQQVLTLQNLLQNAAWTTVATVNPSTCAQSSINVLTH
jgi:hypothetical protein